jgi:hypothetical protein
MYLTKVGQYKFLGGLGRCAFGSFVCVIVIFQSLTFHNLGQPRVARNFCVESGC